LTDLIRNQEAFHHFHAEEALLKPIWDPCRSAWRTIGALPIPKT